ncbi:MAG: hypothetical protein U0641_03250 [Anaerolineae bacterium]
MDDYNPQRMMWSLSPRDVAMSPETRLSSAALLDRTVQAIAARIQTAPHVKSVLIAPSFGRVGARKPFDAAWVAAIQDHLELALPSHTIRIVPGDGSEHFGYERGNVPVLRDSFADGCRRTLDLSDLPVYQIQEPDWPLPVKVPIVAFTQHFLITLSTLATDPYHFVNGSVVHQMSLFPGLLAHVAGPHVRWAARTACTLWKPDLCVLDARHVVVETETRLQRSIDVADIGCVIVGNSPPLVDSTAAELLHIQPSRVPFLTLEDFRGVSQDAEIIGNPVPMLARLAVSPYSYSARLHNAVSGFASKTVQSVDKTIDALDVPRMADFVRRARGGAG